jgi:hypothetical protein
MRPDRKRETLKLATLGAAMLAALGPDGERATVALPAAWSPGQRLPVPGAGGEAIWVELMPGREA